MVNFFGNFVFSLYFCHIVQTEITKLPLVGLKTAEHEYEIPKCVKETSNELEFYLPGQKSEIVFFCPKSTSYFILCPTTQNRCEIEPIPRLRRATDEESQKTECPNVENSTSLYTYGFQVAYSKNFKENEEEPWDAWIEIYTFCFNHAEERISYIFYRISSPKLLASNLLKDQHLYLADKYEFDHFGDPVIKKYVRRIKERYKKHDKRLSLSVKHQAMIATPFDMAFAIWKKPFTHIINYNIFRHPLTASQWARIGIFVRKLAVEGWGELHVKVGMKHPTIGNLYKIWWKLVITSDESHAIAIILHDIALHDDPEPEDGFRCHDRCNQFGFSEMVADITASLVFCCHPNVITGEMSMKSYDLFDLNSERILKPLPVECDSYS